MCSIPTTVLWPSRILELVVLLCSAQLPTHPAVFLSKELIGTFLMEVMCQILILYHTTELGLMEIGIHLVGLEQYFSTVTLGLPQQESSAVRHSMPEELFRVSMWGYILPPQVSLVHCRQLLHKQKHILCAVKPLNKRPSSQRLLLNLLESLKTKITLKGLWNVSI